MFCHCDSCRWKLGVMWSGMKMSAKEHVLTVMMITMIIILLIITIVAGGEKKNVSLMSQSEKIRSASMSTKP